MRGFMGAVGQFLARVAWVAWGHNVLVWVAWVAWIEISAWMAWVHKILAWERGLEFWRGSKK